MLRLIALRGLVGLVTLWFVTILVFVGTEFLPGDVAQAVLGQSATPETVAALREQFGLNEPPLQRYLDWLGGLVTGDLGNSIATGVPISSLIKERLLNTLLLAGLTAGIVVPAALLLGLVAAMYSESLLDRAVSNGSLFLVSIPEFLMGALLVMLFAVELRWLPAVSYKAQFDGIGDMFRTLALPIMTLAAVLLAQMTRMTRATILNILASPYIEMAVLKGVRRSKIFFLHAAANAVGPLANVVALNLAYLVSGVVIVETIFAYPGLAKLIVDAVGSRDFPVVQSCAMIFCTAYIAFMLIADLLAILSNPRLRQ